MMQTAQDIWRELIRLSTEIDKALDEVRARCVEAASLDVEHKQAAATAYLSADGSTVREREAQATLAVGHLALRAKVAAALEKSATEALRSRRQQISAIQSMLAAQRAEAEFSRTGPQFTP